MCFWAAMSDGARVIWAVVDSGGPVGAFGSQADALAAVAPFRRAGWLCALFRCETETPVAAGAPISFVLAADAPALLFVGEPGEAGRVRDVLGAAGVAEDADAFSWRGGQLGELLPAGAARLGPLLPRDAGRKEADASAANLMARIAGEGEKGGAFPEFPEFVGDGAGPAAEREAEPLPGLPVSQLVAFAPLPAEPDSDPDSEFELVHAEPAAEAAELGAGAGAEPGAEPGAGAPETAL